MVLKSAGSISLYSHFSLPVRHALSPAGLWKHHFYFFLYFSTQDPARTKQRFMVGFVFREKYYQMSLNIKRKIQFILGASSKLVTAFDL